MEDQLFRAHTSRIVPTRLASISMERGSLRLLCNDWVGDRHRHDGSGFVNGGRCCRFLDGRYHQRAFLFLLDSVWLAIFLGCRPGTEASQIPSSQSPVPFLIGMGLILTKPACLSHFAVSETV